MVAPGSSSDLSSFNETPRHCRHSHHWPWKSRNVMSADEVPTVPMSISVRQKGGLDDARSADARPPHHVGIA